MGQPTHPNHPARFGEDDPKRPHLTKGQIAFSVVVFLVATYGAVIITLAWRCPA